MGNHTEGIGERQFSTPFASPTYLKHFWASVLQNIFKFVLISLPRVCEPLQSSEC